MRKTLIVAALMAASTVPAFAGNNATISAASVNVNQSLARPTGGVSVPSRPVSVPSLPSRPMQAPPSPKR